MIITKHRDIINGINNKNEITSLDKKKLHRDIL